MTTTVLNEPLVSQEERLSQRIKETYLKELNREGKDKTQSEILGFLVQDFAGCLPEMYWGEYEWVLERLMIHFSVTENVLSLPEEVRDKAGKTLFRFYKLMQKMAKHDDLLFHASNHYAAYCTNLTDSEEEQLRSWYGE